MAEEQQEASQGDMEGERNNFSTKIWKEILSSYVQAKDIQKCLKDVSAAISSRLSWPAGSDEGGDRRYR